MSNIMQILSQFILHNSEYSNAFLVCSLLILNFTGYHYASLFLKSRLNKGRKKEPSFISAVSQRILGFVFFGLIPLLIFSSIQNINIQKYGINIHNMGQSFIWITVFAPLILLINYFLARNETNLQSYPQIRLKNWNIQTLVINFATWLVYLFAYEAFFRGFLLFSVYYTFGISTAIIVNVVIYALAHLPKGNKEMIGSVPFGLVLCMITLNTGSFFAAFFIHGVMAISYEFFSIKAHPEMSINIKNI